MEQGYGMTEAFKVSCVPYYRGSGPPRGKRQYAAMAQQAGLYNKKSAAPWILSGWITVWKFRRMNSWACWKNYISICCSSAKAPTWNCKTVMLGRQYACINSVIKPAGPMMKTVIISDGLMAGWKKINHVYFFVTFGPRRSHGYEKIRLWITRVGILKQLGFPRRKNNG